MYAYCCSQREEKKSAACKVCVSGAFLAFAMLQSPLTEVYNTVINTGQRDKGMNTAKILQVLAIRKLGRTLSVDAILGYTGPHTDMEKLTLLWLQQLCLNCGEISFTA